MVGKQGWKFLTNPDALVTRIFKAKYFPRGDFLSAAKRGSPSFAWHSIWKTQDLVRHGYRWRVGNGRSISVWKEPWLRRDGRLRVESAPVHGLENISVADLWMPETRCWDEELLSELFPDEEARAIMEVNTLTGEANDTRIWHYSKTGEYTVKSAYKLIMEYMYDQEALNVGGQWNVLWKMQIPPKVKHFLWRVARGILPLRANLIRRRISVPPECGLCNTDQENESHLFLICPKAKEIWRAAGLLEIIRDYAATSSFADWLGDLLKLNDAPVQCQSAMILWGIWGERNQIVWRRESKTPNLVADGALSILEEWRTARQHGKHSADGNSGRQTQCEKWHPPPRGFIKCNVDAAFQVSRRQWGWGLAVRDHEGTLLSYRTGWMRGVLEVREGEVLALLDALISLQAAGAQNVMLETDSAEVARAVQGTNIDNTEFGSFVSLCRNILSSQPQYSVVCVRRNRNQVAHELAQRSFSFASPFVGYAPLYWLDSALGIMCTDVNH
ncbi:Putative ribonuclease H protein At1g65750 [Linum perenne]